MKRVANISALTLAFIFLLYASELARLHAIETAVTYSEGSTAALQDRVYLQTRNHNALAGQVNEQHANIMESFLGMETRLVALEDRVKKMEEARTAQLRLRPKIIRDREKDANFINDLLQDPKPTVTQ